MAKRADAWATRNGIVLSLYAAFGAIVGMLVMGGVHIALSGADREGMTAGILAVPWMVTTLLGIQSAYQRGVTDERKYQSLPDSGGETKR